MAQTNGGAGGGLIIQLLPFILIWAIAFAVFAPIAKRKGKGLVTAILFSFPPIAAFAGIYLASLTDQVVKDKLGLE